MRILHISQAHLQFPQANAKTKNCKRACLARPGKKNNETPTMCISHWAASG
jgi:hypothetical protein